MTQPADQPSAKLKNATREAIQQYFANLDGADANNIYSLVLKHVEQPLIETVMQYAENNQSKAAAWLGISRNTLRKLLAKYQIS